MTHPITIQIFPLSCPYENKKHHSHGYYRGGIFAGHVAMDIVKIGIKDGKATHAAMMLKK